MSDAEILEATGRSERTLRRWKASGLPKWARKAIEAHRGLLKVRTVKSYEVWRVLETGEVVCPAGDTFMLSELRAIGYYKQSMDSYRLRNVALERELRDIKKHSTRSKAGPAAANDLEYLPNRSR